VASQQRSFVGTGSYCTIWARARASLIVVSYCTMFPRLLYTDHAVCLWVGISILSVLDRCLAGLYAEYYYLMEAETVLVFVVKGVATC
jgi:hypothetical protein